MEMSLNCLRLGQQGVVVSIDTNDALQRRLRDFGFVPGTQIRCCYRTPGGSVTALGFRGAVVALRTGDLQNIRVRC